MTADTFQVIVDPESGEVLADNAEDARDLIEFHAAVVIDAEIMARRAADARRKLRLLMGVGDAVAGEGHRAGWAVAVKPPASPKRQVIPHALMEHAEALAPLGFAPREVQVTRVDLPKVSDLTSVKGRAALNRLGFTPESFLHTPEPGPPRIEVIPPDGES